MSDIDAADHTRLIDNEAVRETLYTFAQGVDSRDWSLLQGVFLETFEYDYSSHRAGSEGQIDAVDWVAHARKRFETMIATQHTMTNPRVTLEGDTAICRMYVEAWHLAELDDGEDWCTIGGEYINHLLRGPDRRWRISRLCLNRRWTIGNPAVLNKPT